MNGHLLNPLRRQAFSVAILVMVSKNFEGGGISMNRLKDNFNELLEDRTEEVIQQYTQAYIMSSVTQSVDEGREAVIDSVRDGGNTQNKLSVAALQVEATNFTATARLEGAAQGGHAREGQHQLVKAARGAHQGSGSRGRDNMTGSSFAPKNDVPPMAMQYPGHFGSDVDAEPRVKTDTDVPTTTDASVHTTVDSDVNTQYLSNVPGIWDTLWFHAYSDPNTARITILRGGSSSQPVVKGVVDTRSQGAMLAKYSGNDDDDEEVYRPAPPDTPPNSRCTSAGTTGCT
ncbi:hypothetical protein GOBAR_AA03829 [Gossypium barbadense]|uniref:Uncharacterized protein n=1 Tax=Gossypium barbadense TaxID=3634 RepID=A0A2P5YMB5_GOSBA|nr:hypothetical protein GOBAR_AA03829 [Gossypium barbadense]